MVKTVLSILPMEIVSSHCRVPPVRSLFRLNTDITYGASFRSNYFVINCPPSRTAANRDRPFIITFSNKSGNEQAIERKREQLEEYGLNPDEFLSEPPPQTKRRKGRAKKERNGWQVSTEETQAPRKRETHKLLQVLAGKARRKKLLSPKGMDVRPMMEVVKAAAFGILQVAGGCPTSLRPGRWLDLYSGTGSVGIEAMSRGCSQVHFVEMDPWVVSAVLQPNLEWTSFLDLSVIHTVRVEDFLAQAEIYMGTQGTFDYISVTPPYMEVDYGVLMGQISSSSVVGADSFVVVEYPLGTDMLDSCGCLVKIADRRFGRTHLAIYGPKWAQKRR